MLESIIEFLAELWVDGRGEVGELGDGDGFGFDWDGGTGEGVAATAGSHQEAKERMGLLAIGLCMLFLLFTAVKGG